MSKAVIVGLSALLLVGLVAAVTFSVAANWGNPKNGDDINASTKAVQAVCQPTDYKEACFKSMSNVNSDDPKELVKAAFESAKNEILINVDKSKLLQELEKDPKTEGAVKDCRELFQDSIDDLERSFNEIGTFELGKMNELLGNLKSWLSASITYQETCLDGFENTTGDGGVRVRKLLQTSMQMSSNGLAIVNDLSSLFGAIDFSSFNRRRLLQSPVDRNSRGMDDEERKHFWLDKIAKNRRLLKDLDDTGIDMSLLPEEEGGHWRRKLLSTNNEEVPNWLQGSRRELLGAINLTEDLKAKANVVVAQDGSGKYKTIEDALKDVPKMSKDPYIIYIKEGVYNEYLVVLKWMQHLVFVGDGPTKTRITNNKNFVDGIKTFKTATLSVLGDFFMAKDIGIENSAGAIKHQAVALRVQSDQSIFYNCHMDGYQDTLYAHTYRQFYRDCRITGTIDFIFGDATSFFQNCTFVIRKPLDNQRCIVTAQGRMERHQPTGIIIHKSRFEGDIDYMPHKDKNQAFLGRPWKEYSKTIIMESYINNMIAPQGWLPWEGNFGLDTCYYGEYMNEGPGSGMTQRVDWRGIKIIGHTRAESFMPRILFEIDSWIVDSGVPYEPDLFAPAPGPHEATDEDEDPNAPISQPKEENTSFNSIGSSYSSKGNSGGSSSSDSKKEHSNESSDHNSRSSSTSSSSSSNGSSESSSSDSDSNSSSPGSSTNNNGSSLNTSSSSPTLTIANAPTSIAPVPAPAPIEPLQAMSSNPSSEQTKLEPVSMKELERMLMENEEIEEGEEEETNDDMSGNIPDGDEPSPAMVLPPSPAPAPAPAPENNISPTLSPFNDEIDDWLPPTSAPEPEPIETEASDKVPRVSSPKSSSSYKSKYEYLVILFELSVLTSLIM